MVEVTARAAADLMDIQANTATLFYNKIRIVLAEKLEADASIFAGEIELDESYFGGVRKGKRGRGAQGKIPVFGILKRGGKVYTQVIHNTKTDTLMPIIRRKIRPDSIVYTDGYRSYNALDISEFKHYRINHSELFADKQNHINGIENFWNQAKRVLRKYNGIPAKNFYLFLKECEFRFNYGSHKQQYTTLKNGKASLPLEYRRTQNSQHRGRTQLDCQGHLPAFSIAEQTPEHRYFLAEASF